MPVRATKVGRAGMLVESVVLPLKQLAEVTPNIMVKITIDVEVLDCPVCNGTCTIPEHWKGSLIYESNPNRNR